MSHVASWPTAENFERCESDYSTAGFGDGRHAQSNAVARVGQGETVSGLPQFVEPALFFAATGAASEIQACVRAVEYILAKASDRHQTQRVIEQKHPPAVPT